MKEKQETAGLSVPVEVELKGPGIKNRFKTLFVKMLSLKFLAFVVQVFLGIIWFRQLLETQIANAAAWGVWTGYMVGAFTVYTAGNVGTKKVAGYSLPPIYSIASTLNSGEDAIGSTASSFGGIGGQ